MSGKKKKQICTGGSSFRNSTGPAKRFRNSIVAGKWALGTLEAIEIRESHKFTIALSSKGSGGNKRLGNVK